MRKLLIAPTLLALFAVSGFAWYASESAQHRRPSESPPAGSAAQPQPQQPTQATPRSPRDPSSGSRPEQAVPRPPDTRGEPDRQRRRPDGRTVVVPYAGWPWWAYPYPYGHPLGPWPVYAEWDRATVRIDVTPETAQVYVDRYYAGVVDDFDGVFQHLTVRPGPHLFEIRKTGYTTLVFEMNLYPGQSVTYRRTMEPRSEQEPQVVAPLPPGFEEGAAPPSPASVAAPPGDVRFDVTPKDAAVYADGFYTGLASDFSGAQHLLLTAGRHHLSIRLDGYESLEVDLSIESARSITYRASLTKQK